MSDWTDPDVTPVGGTPGGRAPQPGASGWPGGDDPFGSRPAPRRPGLLMLVLGALLLGAGAALAVVGLVRTIESAKSVQDDAVIRGEVRDDAEAGRAGAFSVPGGGRRDYTVYLILKGVQAEENRADLTVRDTACVAEMPDGVQTRFRGARQGASTTIGSAHSVGHFSSLPGRVVVYCGYTRGSITSRRVRPERVEYVVTPGTPGELAIDIVMLVVGVLAAIGGGVLFFVGWWRRRSV